MITIQHFADDLASLITSREVRTIVDVQEDLSYGRFSSRALGDQTLASFIYKSQMFQFDWFANFVLDNDCFIELSAMTCAVKR